MFTWFHGNSLQAKHELILQRVTAINQAAYCTRNSKGKNDHRSCGHWDGKKLRNWYSGVCKFNDLEHDWFSHGSVVICRDKCSNVIGWNE